MSMLSLFRVGTGGRCMKILVCVGNRILAEGLKNILAEVLPGCFLADHFSAQRLFDPDLVLFDSEEEIDTLKARYPEAKFVCLDLGLSDSEVACLVFCHGVSGIIPPLVDTHLFCKALHAVHRGELWIGQDYLKKAVQQQAAVPECRNYRVMSEQDKKIIAMIVLGRTNSEIGNELCLSESTVKAHVSRIYRTLKVKNRAQLTRLASINNWSSHPTHPSSH
jgi:DNA-binding NarL/FixJ family response regulator